MAGRGEELEYLEANGRWFCPPVVPVLNVPRVIWILHGFSKPTGTLIRGKRRQRVERMLAFALLSAGKAAAPKGVFARISCSRRLRRGKS